MGTGTAGAAICLAPASHCTPLFGRGQRSTMTVSKWPGKAISRTLSKKLLTKKQLVAEFFLNLKSFFAEVFEKPCLLQITFKNNELFIFVKNFELLKSFFIFCSLNT